MLTSPHNPKIAHLAQLRDKKKRVTSGETLLDGKKIIQMALDHNVNVKALYHLPPETAEDSAFLDSVRQRQVECQEVSVPVFKKICYGENESGFVALASVPEKRLEELPRQPSALYVILDRLEKPGNIGAILRTSDALQASAVIACDPKTDLHNPNVIRASLGTCFSLPYLQTDAQTLLSFLKQREINCFALAPGAKTTYLDGDYRESTAFVAGNEHEGLSAAWTSDFVKKLSIPMRGAADSLNVSVALTVVLFEASRQRRMKS